MEDTKPKAKLRPRGAPANVHEKLARLDVLAHKALRFWERTLDENSDATVGEKIQVSKLVVEYAWGKPKQQVQVDAKVEVNHKAHVEALTLLALAANGPVIDHNPLNQLANQSLGMNGDILDVTPRAETGEPLNSISEVEIAPALVGRLAGEDNRELTPRPPEGTPGGARASGHPPALDTANAPE